MVLINGGVELRPPNPLGSSRCKEHLTSYGSSCLVTNDHNQMSSCKRRKGAVDLLFQGLKGVRVGKDLNPELG